MRVDEGASVQLYEYTGERKYECTSELVSK